MLPPCSNRGESSRAEGRSSWKDDTQYALGLGVRVSTSRAAVRSGALERLGRHSDRR